MLANSPFSEKHPSRVEEIGGRHMAIAMPMSKGTPILLAPGTTFYGRVIVDGHVWMFSSTFLDKRLDPIAVWLISRPQDFKRIQLRAYVRLETALPATVQPVMADDPPAKAVTKDISGGGVQLVTRLAVERDMPVNVSIDLQDAGIFTAKGEVIRVESDAERNNYTAGIKFVDISERERDKIIKYIFRRQLARRHSGLKI